MAERKPPTPKKPKTARRQRIAMMDKEILDVEGAATLLGVSTTTIYNCDSSDRYAEIVA